MKIKKTKGISEQVVSDATSPSLERSVSLEIIPTMTHDSDHVADQDTDDDEDQGEVIGDVHEPSWLTTDMIMAYALPIVEDAIPSTYRKAEISSESRM